MPLMSRFRKDKKEEDDPLEGLDQADEEEGDEGLFMATSLKPGGAPSDDEPEAEQDEAGLDDLPEPSSAEGTPAEGGGEPAVDGGGGSAGGEDPPVQTVAAEVESSGAEDSSGSGDDALSLFRAETVESGAGHLTKDIEDVPIEELLADLRELRSILVSGDNNVEK